MWSSKGGIRDSKPVTFVRICAKMTRIWFVDTLYKYKYVVYILSNYVVSYCCESKYVDYHRLMHMHIQIYGHTVTWYPNVDVVDPWCHPEGLRQGTRSARMNTMSFVAKSIFSMLKIKITWKTSLSTSDWFLWRIWCRVDGNQQSISNHESYRTNFAKSQCNMCRSHPCRRRKSKWTSRLQCLLQLSEQVAGEHRRLCRPTSVWLESWKWSTGWMLMGKSPQTSDGCFMDLDGLVTFSNSNGSLTCHALLGSWHRDESKVEHQVHVICHLVCFTIRWKLRLELATLDCF